MAAEDEGRTEEPSEYKLEKARKEGRVAKTQELAGSLVLLLTVITLIFLAKWILSQCLSILHYFFVRTGSRDVDVKDPNMYLAFVQYIMKIILPTCAVGVVAAFAGNIIQTRGVVFSWKPIQPKFSKIVPRFGEYFRKSLFSGQGAFNILKSLIKVALIVFVAYLLIKQNIWEILEIISVGNVSMALSRIALTAAKLVIIVAVMFLVISIPDYFVQRHEFMESMKMTKQEQKEEYKEMEGDPEVKARLKQMQQQLLSQNLPKAVAESDVVITNPTHFAVALKYDREIENSVPVVNAKGEDNQAFVIRRLATENNIPIVEDRPLARGLYHDLNVGDAIPEDYFKAIALIYSHILNSSV